MKINTSKICMDASIEHKDVNRRFGEVIAERKSGGPEFRLAIPGTSDLRRQRIQENRQSQQVCAMSTVHCPDGDAVYETSAEQVMEQMVERITGHRTRMRRIQGLGDGERVMFSEPVNPPGEQVSFSFASHSMDYEYEKFAIHSTGSVQLADGRNIDFSLQLTMERESMVDEWVTWQPPKGILMDPLVLNFDCDLRSLVHKTFQFDLNSDGVLDTLNSLQPGTGFLALDINNDKKINDGRELFGPATGHGFQELAKYDSDLNGWIDENDPIFSRLRLWNPGLSSMVNLGDAGVGAICLTHDKSGFMLKDRKNSLMGEVAATGIFLTEAGEVRPMQEIKFALQGENDTLLNQMPQESGADSWDIIRQMISTRQAEIKTLARLRASGHKQEVKQEFLDMLFPEWQKEKELGSVMARAKRVSSG